MSIKVIDRDQGKLYDIVKDNVKIGEIKVDSDSKTYTVERKHSGKVSSSVLSKLARQLIPYDYVEAGNKSIIPSIPSSSSSAPQKIPKSQGCYYTFAVDPKTIHILKSLCRDVFFMDSKGKRKIGKEFFGNLAMKPMQDGRIMLVYNDKKVITGGKDTIDGFEDKVTYHTHPHPTYVEFDAKYAWPSKMDYKSITDTIVHGIGVFHIVVAVEGIYIVSLNDYWCENIDSLKNMIKRESKKYENYVSNLDIEYPYMMKKKDTATPHIKSPHDFCKHANKQGIDNKPVLHTQFIGWKDNITFKIRSPIIGSACKL
jgi:hypothetical protein